MTPMNDRAGQVWAHKTDLERIRFLVSPKARTRSTWRIITTSALSRSSRPNALRMTMIGSVSPEAFASLV